MIPPTNIDNEGITPSNCKIKKLAIYHKSQIQMYIYDKGTVLTIVKSGKCKITIIMISLNHPM